jgi:hypothetical protein
MFSAALTFVAAAHFFTLQARSSSQRFAIVPSFLSPFHASACRPSLRQAAARQYSSLGIMPAALGSPSLSGDEHSRPADPTLLHFRLLARLAPAFAPTSTSHRTLLLCCPCRADSTELSNTSHVTACTRILLINFAARQRDPEPSHRRACSSVHMNAPPSYIPASKYMYIFPL